MRSKSSVEKSNEAVALDNSMSIDNLAMARENSVATSMLSDWYYNNLSKIYALDIDKRLAVLKAYEFFAKRYAPPANPIITEIEIDESDSDMQYQKNQESLIEKDLGKLLDDLETIDF
jgi:hypothetical protein